MRRALPWLWMVGLACCVALPAAAQRAVYCNITEIKAEQLSNGVRITIQADGELQGSFDWDRMIASGQWEWKQYEWGWDVTPTERTTRLSFKFTNARSSLGSGFIPVDKYPVSHVEISIPDEAAEHDGVGVNVDIVTYLPLRGAEEGWWRYDFHAPRTEDGQGRMVVWFSDRFPEPPPPKTPEDLPSELSVLMGEAGLSVHAVNARLQEVANRIAEATGLCVECPSEAEMRVSCHLDRLPVAAAMEALAMGCGLCSWCRPDGSWVLTPEVSSGAGYGSSAGLAIPLRYLRARAAMDLLPNFLLSYLYPDDESNAVVVTGPAWMGERVADDLAKLDTPVPEIAIEVVAVEYTSPRALARSLDLKHAAGDTAYHFHSALGEVDFLRLEGLPTGWSAGLNYAHTSATCRVRSRASLRVQNGKQGRIYAGQQRSIVSEQLGEYGEPTEASLEQVDIGTALEVRPRLSNGEEIVLSFSVEMASLAATDPITGLPTVSRRNAYSTLRVRDGDTILISGLGVAEESRGRRAIPVLSRLPLVGGLFRAPEEASSDLRLAIFVTPRLVPEQAREKGMAGNG